MLCANAGVEGAVVAGQVLAGSADVLAMTAAALVAPRARPQRLLGFAVAIAGALLMLLAPLKHSQTPVSANDIAGRTDFRQTVTVTIDGEHARADGPVPWHFLTTRSISATIMSAASRSAMPSTPSE